MKFSRIILLLRFHKVTHGDEGIRTPDPLLARQVLSQLSYTPMSRLRSLRRDSNP